MTRILRAIAAASVAVCVAGTSVAGQTAKGAKSAPAYDQSARLRKVLPKDVADRVIARIAAARARQLPAQALENRALKFAARGVKPEKIERAVSEHAARLEAAKEALEAARAQRPSRDRKDKSFIATTGSGRNTVSHVHAQGERPCTTTFNSSSAQGDHGQDCTRSSDEVEAGAEAIRMGVSRADVRAFAKNAPKGRPLAVALYVLGSLAQNGVPVSEAMQRVQAALDARASDAELEKLPAQAIAGKSRKPAGGKSRKPADVARDLAVTKRPAGVGAGGPPTSLPGNGGVGSSPSHPVQPARGRP